MTYTVVLPTVYGPMLALRTDINQFLALAQTGAALDHANFAGYMSLMPKGGVMLDIGACLGTFTMAFARHAGTVHTFEAQRILANMIAGSVALNSHEHVFVHNVALGRAPGLIDVPRFNYSKIMNFGSVEFGPKQCEQLSQERQPATETVEVRTLDSYGLTPDFIKIDVEGMEAGVLAGAEETLSHKPVVFIEHGKSDKTALRLFGELRGYEVLDLGADFLWLPPRLKGKVNVNAH